MEDMVKLLKDSPIRVANVCFCGDGCCSWLEWENDTGKAGETFYENVFDLEGLIEGIDFEFVKE